MSLPESYSRAGGASQIILDDRRYSGSTDEQMTFSLLMAMLRRRIPLFLVTLAVCIVLAVVWTSAMPRIYRSHADVVLITTPTDILVSDAPASGGGPTRAEEVETQIQLIRSRDMAAQVFHRLQLRNDPEFRADVLRPRSTLDNILSTLGFDRTGDSATNIGDPRAFRERAVTYLRRALDVTRVEDSFNLRISISDSDAERSTRLANAYARLFTTDDARRRAQRNKVAASVLRPRLDELRAQANSDFAAVQRYRIQTGLLGSAATSLTEQEVSSYNQQIAAAQAQAAEDAASLTSARSQLQAGGANNVGQSTSSSVVGSLRAQRAQLTIREEDLAQRYRGKHPELASVRGQIADIDRQIAAEVNREIRALETEAQSSAQRLSSLLQSRSGSRAELQGNTSAMVQLADLEKRAQASQALYQSYLQRYNEVIAGSGTEQPAARLISAASVPIHPASPNWPLNMALGVVVGVLLGGLLAIGAELSYRGFTTLDDIEARLGVRALGFTPDFRSSEPHGATALETVTDHHDAVYAESLRNVIVSMRQAGWGKVVAITSALPGEGKTTFASCLGLTLAMANKKVIVVDCDLVRADLSRQFGFDSGPGLHEALDAREDAIPRYEVAKSSLCILPIIKPLKSERLTESDLLDRVLKRLREDFDTIILDCPPILPIAEAREIASLADNVVLVVRWRRTTDKMVKSAIRLLPMSIIKNVGVVLSAVDMRKHVRFGGSDAASFYKHYKAYYA